jgi:methyl coenzyme M reductase gamma subunit
MYMNTTTNTPAINATVWDANDTTRTRTVAIANDVRLADDEFIIECRYGYRTIGVLTGRTRKFFGIDCPTIERYEIETTVIDDAIWGVRGAKVPGTFATRPLH